MKKNFIPIFSLIFLVVGIFVAGISAYLAWSTLDFLKVAVSTDGKVVRVESRRNSHNANMYSPVVSFQTPDGVSHQFTGQVWTSSRDWREGQSVAVLYRPESPEDARLHTFFQLWFAVLITGVLGLAFSTVGGVFLGKHIRRKNEIEWLRQNGATIHAKVVSVGLNTSIKIQGRSPYVIECQWTDPNSGKLCVTLSEDLWFDPIQTGHVRVGDELKVLYKPTDPTRSWVDIEPIEKLAA